MPTEMDVAAFCRQSGVLILAGKGGVGKTTVAASVARAASLAGLDVMLIELEGRTGAAALLGHPAPLDYREVELAEAKDGAGSIRARSLTPDDVLVDYLAERGLGKLSRRLASTGALDVVATAVPGFRDVLVLGKVKQLEKSDHADLVILDAPAAGHALTFLTSASGLAEVARVGPIRTQAADVAEMLSDPDRCRVMLVTLPEETPVNETAETAIELRDRVGVTLAPVVVNAVLPRVDGVEQQMEDAAALSVVGTEMRDALVEAARFRLRRLELQARQMERLAEALDLPQLRLPDLFAPASDVGSVDQLAKAFGAAVEGLPDGLKVA